MRQRGSDCSFVGRNTKYSPHSILIMSMSSLITCLHLTNSRSPCSMERCWADVAGGKRTSNKNKKRRCFMALLLAVDNGLNFPSLGRVKKFPEAGDVCGIPLALGQKFGRVNIEFLWLKERGRINRR